MSDAAVTTDLKSRIKHLIVDRLKLEISPESIGDDTPLFGDSGLGLDSIDALEMVLGIEQEFGVRIEDEEVGSRALESIEALAQFIEEEGSGQGGSGEEVSS